MSVVANVAINVDSSGAVSKLRSVQNQAELTEKAFGGVTGAATKLALAFGLLEGAKFVFAKTAELEAQSRSLQVLTGSAEKAGQIIKELQKLGAVTPFTSSELIDSAKRLQAFGVSTEKVVATTSRLADAAGATGAELSGLVTAYGQVQAKGRLQGEELLQFQERGIGLQEELNKMYGDKFQEALKKGQISAEAVEVALIRLTQTGGKYAGGAIAQSDTLAGLMSTLQDSVDELARRFGTELSQSIKNATKFLIGFVEGVAAIPQPIMEATGKVVLFIAQLVLVEKAIKAIIGLRLAFIGAMTGMAGATAASGAAATTSAGAFALYTNNVQTLKAQSAAATPVVTGLKNVLQGIVAMGVITVAVNIAVSGFQNLLAANAELNKLRGRKQAGGAAAMFKGSTKEEVIRQQQIARQTKAHEEKTLAGLSSPGSRIAQFLNVGGVLEGLGVPSTTGASQRRMQSRARIGSAGAVLGLDSSKFPSAVPQTTPATPDLLSGTTATGPTGGKAGGADDAKRAADEALRESQRVADVVRDQQFITQQLEAQLKFANEIFEAEQKGDAIRVLNLQTLEQQVLAENDIAKAMRGEADPAAKLAIAAAGRVKLQAITNKGVQDVIALQVQQEKSFDAIIADLELELKLKQATTEQERERLRIEAARAKLQADLKGQGFQQPQIDQITGLQAQIAAPDTAAQTIEKRIGALKDEITGLTSISNIAITSAEGIGAAFGQAFQGLISGSMSAKEALSGFFKSVGDMFISMATEIIAKQLVMITLQAILKALGGAPGGGDRKSVV